MASSTTTTRGSHLESEARAEKPTATGTDDGASKQTDQLEDGNATAATAAIRDQTDIEYPEGGARAWLVAAGVGGVLFSTLGVSNSFGVFQAYYMTHQLSHESPDNIAWIGGTQVFLVFAAGLVGGPLFDRFGAWVIRPAAVVYIFAIMMTSLCSQYWQLMLAQGILTGASSGLVMSPCMAAVSQYFHKKRGAAMGIAVMGSSLGAVAFPLILSRLLNESDLGFGWTVRIVGFINVPVLAFGALAIKARLPPRQSRFLLPSAFKNRLYSLLVICQLCLVSGMFTPVFFLPSYAESQGMDPTLASYLIAMLNGASAFGRVIPGILGDKLGRLNMLVAMGLATGVCLLCWTKVNGVAGNVVYAVAFGFASGAILSGGSVALTLCPSDPKDIGTYLGMAMAISSVAALVAPPITGVMLRVYGGFLEISILSGVVVICGSLAVLYGKTFTKEGVFGRV